MKEPIFFLIFEKNVTSCFFKSKRFQKHQKNVIKFLSCNLQKLFTNILRSLIWWCHDICHYDIQHNGKCSGTIKFQSCNLQKLFANILQSLL